MYANLPLEYQAQLVPKPDAVRRIVRLLREGVGKAHDLLHRRHVRDAPAKVCGIAGCDLDCWARAEALLRRSRQASTRVCETLADLLDSEQQDVDQDARLLRRLCAVQEEGERRGR